MLIRFTPAGDAASLARLIDEVASAPDVGLVAVLACDANGFTPQSVDDVLRGVPKPLIGGIFPHIVLGKRLYDFGTIVVGLNCRATVLTLDRLDDNGAPEMEVRLAQFQAATPHASRTLLVVADGRVRNIPILIDSLFNTFGLDLDYLGGGAGSLTLVQKPCVMTNQGLLDQAAVLAMTDIGAGIGVAHGWTPVSQPFKVTEAELNTIISLDWRPAADVYREVVEQHSGLSFRNTAFFELAKGYPFGIAKLDTEMVVRDPVAEHDGRLVCIGDVRSGTYVQVLNGNTKSLIDAAGRAYSLAESTYRGRGPAGIFLMDCVSRVLFLQDDFSQELERINPGLPLVGALSMGEIANCGRECLEFYNKTSVVGLLDA